MLSTALGRLRLVGFLEGLSFIILLTIAMPLKYKFGMPQAVQVVGMAHGVLFVLFVALAAHAKYVYNWSYGKMLWLWIASFLPFGTFYADYKLLRPQITAS